MYYTCKILPLSYQLFGPGIQSCLLWRKSSNIWIWTCGCLAAYINPVWHCACHSIVYVVLLYAIECNNKQSCYRYWRFTTSGQWYILHGTIIIMEYFYQPKSMNDRSKEIQKEALTQTDWVKYSTLHCGVWKYCWGAVDS